MAAVRVRAAAELRRRWKATVLLAVLIGLTGGVVLAAVAGARRTDTVMDRFLAYHQATNVAVEVQGLDTDAVRRLPMVAEVAEGAYMVMVVALPSGEPNPDAFGEINPFGGRGEPWPGSSNRPILVAGRLPSKDRPLEVAVDETLADRRHLEVGDTLRMWGYTPAQVERAGQDAGALRDPAGGAFDLTVTGILRTPIDLAPVPTGQDVAWLGSEELILTPAFLSAHGARVANLSGGFEVRLRNGLRDLDAFAAAVRRLPGGRDANVYANSDAERTVRKLERAIRIEVSAQLVFAALAALTGLFVVGQSIARQVQLDAADHPALRALGMTSGQLVAAVLLRGALVGVGGALLATAMAVLLSPLTPIGLARRAEVDPGVAVDAPVLVLGVAGLLLFVLARTALAGWAATRASGAAQGGRSAVRRPSRAGDSLAAAGGPPSAVIGTRLAFESGQGAAALPARTAAVGAVVAVAAVAAALTFGSSLGHLAGAPVLQGWAGDAIVGNPRGRFDSPDREARRLAGNPVVGGFSSLTTPAELSIRVDGVDVVAFGIDPLEGTVLPPTLQGRQVRSADELAIGPVTLRRLGREVGDVVEVAVRDRRQRVRIVGTTLLHSQLSNDLTMGAGALLTLDGLRRLVPDAAPNLFLVEYAPGADPEAAFQSLRRDFGRIVLRPLDNEEVNNLVRVGGLPYVLAGLLALLGVGTIAHTLVSSIRHRRRDLAVLKTLGFVRGQVRATVAWQATGFAALAVVAGIPLGVAAGRWAWVLVNQGLHSLAGPVTPILAVLAIVPATVVMANLVAALPARSAAATRPAVVLRSE
jgi:ABC-type lipoprotein release transport system permease subunit